MNLDFVLSEAIFCVSEHELQVSKLEFFEAVYDRVSDFVDNRASELEEL